ncbi:MULTISPECIES: hypothetical protein [Mesobacillus]|uniref:Uncharacterized protein n=1 Tax=Mesobacillus stamsii TaxID=225347 RepID=A0ABU0FWN4_9BACI|nr:MULTISPECIES: hypothetical protein [Mesobacillus]MDQ0414348.1 hypothetical protein [Mesobacillus stamsii]
MNGLSGLEGTIDALKARQEFENRILENLHMPMYILNNSEFDLDKHRDNLKEVLEVDQI